MRVRFGKKRRKLRIADHLAPGRGIADYHTVKLRKYDSIDKTEEGLFFSALWGALGGIFSFFVGGFIDSGLPNSETGIFQIFFFGISLGFIFSWSILLILSHVPIKLFESKTQTNFIKILMPVYLLGLLIPVLLGLIFGGKLVFLELDFYKFWAVPLIPFTVFLAFGFSRFLKSKKKPEIN